MTKKSIIAIVAGIVFPLYAIAGQPSAQITHGPYLQNLSEDEVTVVWTTDKPCKSWVEFSKKEAGKSFYSQPPRKAYASQDGLYCVDTLHRVTVKGLEKIRPILQSIVARSERIAGLPSCYGFRSIHRHLEKTVDLHDSRQPSRNPVNGYGQRHTWE